MHSTKNGDRSWKSFRGVHWWAKPLEEQIMKREASCSCGQLSIVAEGEPVKISAGHCRECQRRTGSAFGVAVFFDRKKVAASGAASNYARSGDSGRSIEFRFCPACGSTVFWMPEFREDLVAVALGCFDKPSFLVPTQSVYEESRQGWVGFDLSGGGGHPSES
jgi:hypothetical protein